MNPPTLMGVINVTPDSFSDGGQFGDADSAIAHGKRLIAEGVAILDVGGESTRPGAEPVAEAEELARVVPVVEGLVADRSDQQISIDTAKLAVAEAALAAGATIVNDVTAFQATPEMAGLVAERGAALERRSNATLSGRYLRRSTRRSPLHRLAQSVSSTSGTFHERVIRASSSSSAPLTSRRLPGR